MIDSKTVAEMLSVLKSESNIGMVGPLIINPDGSEQRGCRRDFPDLRSGIMRTLRLERFAGSAGVFSGFDHVNNPVPKEPVQVPAISGACMLVSAEAVAKVGLLDDAYFLHCEDLDWCYRFAKSGWKVMFVPTAKAVHFQGTSSASVPVRVEMYKHAGMWRFYRKFYSSRDPLILQWLIATGIFIRFMFVALVKMVTKLG